MKRDRRRRPGSKWAKYNADLVRRTNRAVCPLCGAEPGKLCIVISGRAKGRKMKTTNHYARRDAARLIGYIGFGTLQKRRKK